MIALSKEAACLTPGCKQAASTRGLCHSCYHSARSLVSRGLSTYEELQKLNLIRESERPRSRFLQAFFEKTGNKPTKKKIKCPLA